MLIKSGAITHSTHFDQRMVILVTTSASPVTSQSVGGLNSRSGTIVVQMPPSNLIAPPGQYMLFLLGKDNTPSPAIYVSLGVPVPANAPQPPQDSGVLFWHLPHHDCYHHDPVYPFQCPNEGIQAPRSGPLDGIFPECQHRLELFHADLCGRRRSWDSNQSMTQEIKHCFKN